MLTELNKISDVISELPPFPSSVNKIIQMSSQEINPREVIELIKYDPVLTTKILRVVNSAYIGLRMRITSISQAYMLLGFNTTKNLLISISVMGSLPEIEFVANLKLHDFLIHSLSVAIISKKISDKLDNSVYTTEDFFIAGLLHDFGKIVLASYDNVSFSQAVANSYEKKVQLYLCEDDVFGINHCQVGYHLGKKWNLPECLLKVMNDHHFSSEDILTNTVSLSNEICNYLQTSTKSDNITNSGNSGDFSDFRLSENEIEIIRKVFRSEKNLREFLAEELEKAKVFITE